MLEPADRALLVDGLRPPPGMSLSQAVGTTFSLDLHALLLAPVTFALFDALPAEDGERVEDPLTVLEAVRRHAGTIDLFCQAGQIALPDRYRPIVSYLEETVHPCALERPHRIFHPKLWALRFVDHDTKVTSYRLLVLSRNLTFSSSWDTVVQLDGLAEPQSPELADLNKPLSDLIRYLPDLAVRPSDRFDRVRSFADELLSVRWDLPEGFTSLGFLAFGLPGSSPTLPDYERLLVISPFASASRLSTLTQEVHCEALISRTETLDRIPTEILDRFESVYTLSSNASESAASIESPAPQDEAVAEGAGTQLTGLHAKVYIAESASDATIITGSPNATDAAFSGNVEFAVSLTAPKRSAGIDAVLRADPAEASLIHMLEPYHRDTTAAVEPSDADSAAMELEELGRQIARMSFTVAIEGHAETTYRAIVAADEPLPQAGDAVVHLRLLSQQPVAAVPLAGGASVSASFAGLSLESVTSFLIIDLRAESPEGRVNTVIVVNARLTGAPEDRHQRILTALLSSKSDVVRYLLFLLADVADSSGAAELAQLLAQVSSGDSDARDPSIPLFESMVRALARSPQSLDHIDRLIRDLERTEHGRALLPDGLSDIWPAMWQARQEIAP